VSLTPQAARTTAPSTESSPEPGRHPELASEIRHPELASERIHLSHTLQLIDERIHELAATPPAGKNWVKESVRRLKMANLRSLKDARSEPYFGRVDFTPTDRTAVETYRIGRSAAPGVTDWRAPVASLFYARGGSSYAAPGGTVSGRVGLRRYYRIEESELLEVFDARVADEVLDSLSGGAAQDGAGSYLVSRLSRQSSRHMRDIVATIQAEQDAVLRAPPYQVVVLQGVAGSGKTAVALHRVAYLLYTCAGKMEASRVLVLAPSRLLLEYVERLLPGSLGVSGVRQMTTRQWQLELLGLGGGRVRMAPGPGGAIGRFLQTAEAVDVLGQWATAAPQRVRDSRAGIAAGGQRALDLWVSFLGSPQGAATCINGATRSECSAWTAQLMSGRLSGEDLAAMTFLAERLRGAGKRPRYDHVVVDEAQDLVPLVCDVLARRCSGPSLTLVGDLAQSLRADPPISWSAVLGDSFRAAQVSMHEFRISYRPTSQITRFARAILERARSPLALPEPSPRDGPEPSVHACASEEDFHVRLKLLVSGLAGRHASVAVITPDAFRARELLSLLAPEGFWPAGAGERDGSPVKLVAPLSSVRGMEFDAVVVTDAGRTVYPADAAGLRRLYTAVTRAMHELHVLYAGAPSPLLRGQ
jgi:DNA helicase-2/ATP-dependent DNA helicase PcrA